MEAIGATLWAIAEGYIPGKSTGSGRELASHETVCILNAADTDAHVAIMAYFSDREPARAIHIHRASPTDAAPFALTTSAILRKSQSIPISPALLPQTSLLSCSILASTRDRRR
jgi:hypothetical protein